MDGIIITHRGMEDIAAKEIEELTKAKTTLKNGYVSFSKKKIENFATLCYRAQSAHGVYVLLAKKVWDKVDFSAWMSAQNTWSVRVVKLAEQEKPTQQLEQEYSSTLMDLLTKQLGKKPTVALKNPDVRFVIVATEKDTFLCVDLAGIDLSKRSHAIYSHPTAIKATLAYGLVRLAGFDKKQSLLDPFSASGIITTEAALFASSFPVRYYDKDQFVFKKLLPFQNINLEKLFSKKEQKVTGLINNVDAQMKYIQFARKNAKIAGIDKHINYSRIPVEWLDTKFKENTVDCIVTKMPNADPQKIQKLYDEFLYQAEYIIKDKGLVVVIGSPTHLKAAAKKNKFKIKEQRAVWSGKQSNEVFVLKK